MICREKIKRIVFLVSDCCEITDVTKCEGEASANNRKAKLIFFYEWEIKADWKGKKIFYYTS